MSDRDKIKYIPKMVNIKKEGRHREGKRERERERTIKCSLYRSLTPPDSRSKRDLGRGTIRGGRGRKVLHSTIPVFHARLGENTSKRKIGILERGASKSREKS